VVFGPVPARRGINVCAQFPDDEDPILSVFEVYNVVGERVNEEAFTSFDKTWCVDTRAMAPGVYFLRSVVGMRSGEVKDRWQKIVVSP
jgi:hypothetical protein